MHTPAVRQPPDRPLRVLITNNTLALRGGTELYVRDLALGLLARGHVPICYSTLLGEVADEMREATVPVVDDLDRVAAPPDVIHGHHHLEAMTALARFPGVPAIHVCHGWSPWPEIPPRFPRIRRYVAVSDACRDKLVLQHGVPEEQVVVLLSFVDLVRFPPRGPLPDRPRRALVFSNAAGRDGYVTAVRAACAREGVTVDVAGLASGHPCSAPGGLLAGYDLVFARGRAALEATAVGCAVVVCDEPGVGPLVRAADLQRVRALNFGQRLLRAPIDADLLHREILRYDAADAADVSRRVRLTAGRDATVDAYLDLYRKVIAEWAAATPSPEQEARELGAYLRWLSPRAKGFEHAAARLRHVEQEHAALRGTLTFRWRERLLRRPLLADTLRWFARLRGTLPRSSALASAGPSTSEEACHSSPQRRRASSDASV